MDFSAVGRQLASRLACAVVATAALVYVGAPEADERPVHPIDDGVGIAKTSTADLQAAVVDSGRCGPYGNTLGPLVSETDLAPDGKSLPRRVCLRNAGQIAGSVALGVEAVTDVDAECSPTEVTVDPTCGRRRQGELAPVVKQLYGLDRGCANAAATEMSRPLLDLASQPVVLSEQLRPGEVVCVSLRVQHEPDDERSGLLAQTDELRWTYRFSLTTA